MSESTKRTVSLSSEQSRYIDRLVTDGRYGSASEVVKAGLDALSEQDQVVDHWLRDEVVPVVDAMRIDPSRAIPAKRVFAAIRKRHAKRVGASRRDA
jgi:antitoxin ParD1/3/4